MVQLPFTKMHGLGNDFVVFDRRRRPVSLNPQRVRWLSDRRYGVGCDQVLLIDSADESDVTLSVYNADGSTAGTCGNGVRCIAALLMAETGQSSISIAADHGTIVRAVALKSGLIAVDMGIPKTKWWEIPLAHEMDTQCLDLASQAGPGVTLKGPAAVSMGNPHVIFFVPDVDAVPLESVGSSLEKNPIFPEGANISVVSIENRQILHVKVWERGCGLTLACGSAACASVVAASRRGFIDRHATVNLPGGSLEVEWSSDEHVHMTGPTAVCFSGSVDFDLVTFKDDR